MKTKSRKHRLYSKRQPRLPKPVPAKRDKGFSLRMLQNADHRYAVVKELHRRLKQLMEDTGTETLQREWLCARAVFLSAHLESMEYDAVTGKEINWRQYLMSTRALCDVLSKLGLNKETKSAKRLSDYVVEARRNGKKH